MTTYYIWDAILKGVQAGHFNSLTARTEPMALDTNNKTYYCFESNALEKGSVISLSTQQVQELPELRVYQLGNNIGYFTHDNFLKSSMKLTVEGLRGEIERLDVNQTYGRNTLLQFHSSTPFEITFTILIDWNGRELIIRKCNRDENENTHENPLKDVDDAIYGFDDLQDVLNIYKRLLDDESDRIDNEKDN